MIRHPRMYDQDLDIGQPDGHSTMHLAVHHLQLAAAMFDRFPPETYISVLGVHAADIPQSVKAMLATVTAKMEFQLWLRDWKAKALEEMRGIGENDPALEPIWERYAELVRVRLVADGVTGEQIPAELAYLASMLRDIRMASA